MTVTRTRARSAQDVGGLGPLEPGVDGDQHRAGLQAEGGHDPLGAVVGPDAHAVAGLDPDATRAPPKVRACRPARRRSAASAVLDGRSGAVPAGGVGGDRRDGPPPGRPVTHRVTVSATFISRARLPPMILRTAPRRRPCSSST